MNFNPGDMGTINAFLTAAISPVFSLSGEVEESDWIQVFTAEILYEFIDIHDTAFHLLSSDCINFHCSYFGKFPCILNGRYIAVFNLFVVNRNSVTGFSFSGSK